MFGSIMGQIDFELTGLLKLRSPLSLRGTPVSRPRPMTKRLASGHCLLRRGHPVLNGAGVPRLARPRDLIGKVGLCNPKKALRALNSLVTFANLQTPPSVRF
jgi:hypothetical protein